MQHLFGTKTSIRKAQKSNIISTIKTRAYISYKPTDTELGRDLSEAQSLVR